MARDLRVEVFDPARCGVRERAAEAGNGDAILNDQPKDSKGKIADPGFGADLTELAGPARFLADGGQAGPWSVP
jgi:hypothetical protein